MDSISLARCAHKHNGWNTTAPHTVHDLELIQVRVVRIFNTYGPRMALDDGRVVSNFLAQALTGQPMTVYGDGSQSRSFQFVSDLVEGALCWSCCLSALHMHRR